MLNSVDDVIEALGGPSAAAAIAGVGPPAVSNWKARGKISQSKFVLIGNALELKGLKACPSVFGFKIRDEARA